MDYEQAAGGKMLIFCHVNKEQLSKYRFEIITNYIIDIHNSRYILKNLLKSIFSALPKKSDALECEGDLMGHIIKLLQRIIMRRNKIQQKISDEHVGL